MKLSRDLNDLTEKVRYAAHIMLEKHPEVFITETGRSEAQQRENISRGVSWTMDSKHMMNPKSRAFDIAFHGDTLYPSDFSKWRSVADTLKECGMNWGYDMWKTDKPHFECDGKQFNKSEMDERDYKGIYNANFSDPILKDWDGDKEMSEGNIKAFIEIYGEKLLHSDKFKESVIDIINTQK